ncbi:MAG: phosphonate ABC transporter, permease protein PhnE [Chloroflexi bacterium]|nr:phosphonate ABC transporter, permease protein PhnE [Chloroflexota bacterium]
MKKQGTLISILAVILSILVPGLGQIVQKRNKRGSTILLLAMAALLIVVWYKVPAWYYVVGLFWLWNIVDVLLPPKGAPLFVGVLIWLVLAYGIGSQVTNFDPGALFKNQERAAAVINPMLHPSFFESKYEERKGWAFIEVPCSANPPLPDKTVDGVRVFIAPSCANVNEYLAISAEGLWPDYPVTLYWIDTISAQSGKWESVTDSEGKVTFLVAVPPRALTNSTDPTSPTLHQPTVEQRRQIKGIQLTKTGGYLLQGIYETIALALVATTLGAILALPISFLAARNLMGSNPFTMAIYYIVRTLLNFFRSIEALILAIIFVVIVGLGPFPGMLAITVHTIAALGKLYSEVIEGINPGPIEAVRATGANWVQVVRYAVIPQIIPSFTALTIYRWDINVRSSTIIGFVGGGGIGFYLYQWILLGDYRSLSSAFIAIALVVIILDFFSARLREKIR